MSKIEIKAFNLEGNQHIDKYEDIASKTFIYNGERIYSDADIFKMGLEAVRIYIIEREQIGVFGSSEDVRPSDYPKLKISELDELMGGSKFDIKVLGIKGTQMAIEVIGMLWDKKFKEELLYEDHPDAFFECVIPVPKGKFMPKQYKASMVIKNVGIRYVSSAKRIVASLCKYKAEKIAE